ncbi:MAG: VCBS repeat-containing protein [Planctomycetes bacterium]|nr:VCBS repeat-containing protein [Planctomycetota bacterium]
MQSSIVAFAAGWVCLLAAGRGLGQGAFYSRLPVESVSGGAIEPDRAGDLNGDGYEDFAVRSAPNSVKVISGFDRSVIGVFGTGESQGGAHSLAGADVDGNGTRDMVYGTDAMGDSSPNPSATVGGWLQAVDGATLQTLWWTTGSGTPLGQVVRRLGDVNGDGTDELLVQAGNCFFFGCLYIVGAGGTILGTIFGSSTNGLITSYGPDTRTFRAGDVDGDGVVDLGQFFYSLSLAPGVMRIYSGASLGATLVREHTGFGLRGFSMGDRNGDGRAEYVIAQPGTQTSTAGTAWLFDGMTGAILQTYAVPGSVILGVTGGPLEDDLDGDGMPDFILGNGTLVGIPSTTGPPGAYVFSSLTGAVIDTLPDGEYSVGAVGDLDADGRVDIVARVRHQGIGEPPLLLALWMRRTLKPVPQQVAPGGLVQLEADLPAQAGSAFHVLLSGSVATGFPLGTRRIPLDPDALFLATLGDYSLAGFLDATGNATRAVAVPPDPALSGATFYAAVVTLGPGVPFFVRTIGAPEPISIL